LIERLRALARDRLGIEPPDPHAAEREEGGFVVGERVVAAGYHGLPVLKRAQWTWQIPLYFFLSGMAGTAYLVATAAEVLGDEEDRPVVTWGRRLALTGVAAGVPLLVDDLKRPERFMNMLRIVKPRSPMSIGAWALFLFGPFAALGVFRTPKLVGLLGAPLAAFVSSYTGVLLAATAVPLWGRARAWLAPLFFCSGLSTSVAALRLLTGNRKLRDLETAALCGEMVATAGMLRALGPLGRPLYGRSEFWISVALGQVLPLLAKRAEVLALVGGLLLRYEVVEAGKRSADDPQSAFLYHR
jgi:formate-dependent nitrite reductase membrane component NrfD